MAAAARSLPFQLIFHCIRPDAAHAVSLGGFDVRHASRAAIGGTCRLCRDRAPRSLDQARADCAGRSLCDDHVRRGTGRLRDAGRTAGRLPVRRDGAVVGQLHHQRMARRPLRRDASDQAVAPRRANRDVAHHRLRAIHPADDRRHAGGQYAGIQFCPGRRRFRRLRRDLQCASDPRQGSRVPRRHRGIGQQSAALPVRLVRGTPMSRRRSRSFSPTGSAAPS